jgi:hypothetical protein
MAQRNPPMDGVSEFITDEKHSQIMIEIDSSRAFAEAKRIIEESGAQIFETFKISENWMLIKLDIMDMREVALRLSENGFLIKGINASPVRLDKNL